MSSPAPTSPVLSRWATDIGGALVLGAGLRWTTEIWGSNPRSLVGAAALLGLGLGAAALSGLALTRRRRSIALLAAGGGAVLLPDLGQGGAIAAALGLGAALGLSGCSAPLAAAALLVPVGFVTGPLGALLGAAALVLAPERGEDSPPPPRGNIAATLLITPALASATAAWCAARPLLDPTPAGAMVVVLGLGVGAAVSAVARPAAAAAAALGLGALLVERGALEALPGVAHDLLVPLAGVEDPRPRIAALLLALGLPAGLALGAAAPHARPGWPTAFAAATGLALGLEGGPDTALGLCVAAAIIGVGLLLSSSDRPRWFGAAGTALAGAAAAWAPSDAARELPRGMYAFLRSPDGWDRELRARDSSDLVAGGWGPDGSVSLERPRGGASGVAREVLEGFPLTGEGRAADAERLAGHLASALAARSDSALVIGDEQGLVTAALATQQVDDVVHVIADPAALRARVDLDPPTREALFRAGVRWVKGPSEAALSERGDVDLIVEIARTPWTDGRQGLPGSSQLRQRREHLRPGGTYVLVVPTAWMEEDELRGLLGLFADRFAQTWVFLPPSGGDQLLIAGWGEARPVEWGRIVQAFTLGAPELEALGIRDPIDLADRAVVGTAGVKALAEGGVSPARLWLGPVLHRRPRMLLPLLLPHLEGPSGWIEAGVDPKVIPALEARVATNRHLIELLQRASTGDFKDIFESSRQLAADPEGQRALEPLVEPFLEHARNEIEIGSKEGPTSPAWGRCLRELEAARLVHPSSATAAALAGKCRLAVGDSRRASEEFEAALAADPGELEALLGLAQVEAARGELASAEARLREATRRHPQVWRSWYHLGALLLAVGRLDEAEGALAQSRELAGDSSTLPTAVLAEVALQKGDPQTALTLAQRAVARETSARNLHVRGWAWMELGQLSAADRDFRDAIMADSRYWRAHGDLGILQATQGDYPGAIASFERVLELDPGNAGAQANLDKAKAKLEEQQRLGG